MNLFRESREGNILDILMFEQLGKLKELSQSCCCVLNNFNLFCFKSLTDIFMMVKMDRCQRECSMTPRVLEINERNMCINCVVVVVLYLNYGF